MPNQSSVYPHRPSARVKRGDIVSIGQLRGMTILGTFILIFGLIIAAFAMMSAPSANAAFARPAPIIGAALILSVLLELRGGIRNVVRLDIFMLFVLYLLTFFEFLFHQEDISYRISMEAAKTSAIAAIVGFGGIAIGRLFFLTRNSISKSATFSVSPNLVFQTLLLSTFFGYLYMLLAVNFNVVEMVNYIMQPRFTQPWARGRLGGLSSLLNEVGLLKYLIAPLVGAMLAQRHRYNAFQLMVGIGLLAFVLFEGFASGTRNVFLSNVMTFGAAFTLLMRKPTILNAIKIWVPLLAISFFSLSYLLQVRTHGLAGVSDVDRAPAVTTVSVDMNLINVAMITDAFPERYQFLGLEIPMTAFIRPIPRAVWPGKPEGLSVSIEEVVGAGSNMTISSTFVGEFYMAGGFPAIAIAALLLGAVAGWWNQIGARATSTLQMILFASAFFPAGIAMRSFMSAAPPVLPVIGFAVIIYLLGGRSQQSRRSLPVKRVRPR